MAQHNAWDYGSMLEDQSELASMSIPLLNKGPVPLPNINASPEAVRTYISQVLITKCSAGSEKARELASAWNPIGTGKELRNYPVSLFRTMFGEGAAWYICKEVFTREFEDQLRLDREYNEYLGEIIKSGTIKALLIQSMLSMLYLILFGRRCASISFAAGVSFTALVWIVGKLMQYRERRKYTRKDTPEEQALRKLRRAYD